MSVLIYSSLPRYINQVYCQDVKTEQLLNRTVIKQILLCAVTSKLWYNIRINADIICSAGIYGRAKFLAYAKTHMTNYIMVFLEYHDIISTR